MPGPELPDAGGDQRNDMFRSTLGMRRNVKFLDNSAIEVGERNPHQRCPDVNTCHIARCRIKTEKIGWPAAIRGSLSHGLDKAMLFQIRDAAGDCRGAESGVSGKVRP